MNVDELAQKITELFERHRECCSKKNSPCCRERDLKIILEDALSNVQRYQLLPEPAAARESGQR